jgi:hypothetical protein
LTLSARGPAQTAIAGPSAFIMRFAPLKADEFAIVSIEQTAGT